MGQTAGRWQTRAAMMAAGLAMTCAAFGQTPEQEKLWAAQKAQKQADDKAKADLLAHQRDARRADPMAWVRTLDPMSEGGWVFRSVGSDGSWAYFSTDHQLKRSGHTVTAWLRQEFAEAQRNSNGDPYSSAVERVEYDCSKERRRVLIVIYYASNNLAGSQQSEEPDPKQIDWEPIVPGTQSESISRWTCGTGSAGARP
jgi:hypothetical protein